MIPCWLRTGAAAGSIAVIASGRCTSRLAANAFQFSCPNRNKTWEGEGAPERPARPSAEEPGHVFDTLPGIAAKLGCRAPDGLTTYR